MSKVVDQDLKDMREFLDNMQGSVALKHAAAEVGVDAPMLERGEALYERTQLAAQHQRSKIGSLTDARNKLKEARKAARKLYKRHLGQARGGIEDPGVREKLELDGARPTVVAKRQEQIRRFYAVALESPEMQAAVADIGLTLEKLEAGRTAIRTIDTMISNESRVRGEKELATKQMHQDARKMRAWMRATRALIEVGASDKPELLKAIGVTK